MRTRLRHVHVRAKEHAERCAPLTVHSRSELVTYGAVVIVFVVIMVAIVAGLDIGFAKLVLLVFG